MRHNFTLQKDGHEEAQEELPNKTKLFFASAVQLWDADFYVKVDDNIDIDLGKLLSVSSCVNYYETS